MSRCGVGLALEVGVRRELLREALLVVVLVVFGFEDGLAFSLASLLWTESNSKPHRNGAIKRLPGMFIWPP